MKKVHLHLPLLEKAFRCFLSGHGEDFYIDDITWNDLDLDKVWDKLDYTESSAGKEMLYRMLRMPLLEKDKWEERAEFIAKLDAEKAQREALQRGLSRIGYTGAYCLEEYLQKLGELPRKSIIPHIFMDLLYIPVLYLVFAHTMVGVAALFALICVQIITYFKEKGQVNPYLVCFAYILRMIRGAKELSRLRIPVIAERQDELRRLSLEMASFSRFSSLAMSMQNPSGGSSPIDLLMDYVKMLFHIDLMKFRQMQGQILEKSDLVRALVETIGYLDACCSISICREKSGKWCVPACGEVLLAEEAYHPLLPAPVKNSFVAEKGILMTGSNASGKSTFLKTVALNTVFAQSICTAFASRWEAPFFRVITSMSLRDDVEGGDSYFMVEIKALKRVLDSIDEGKCDVLCCVDEVLRGTNTAERIAASTEILKALAGGGVLCFAATHDLELTELLSEYYVNYHFSESFVQGDIVFDYLLKEGKANSRNAIRLLDNLGFSKEITERASKVATHFVENGKWEKM